MEELLRFKRNEKVDEICAEREWDKARAEKKEVECCCCQEKGRLRVS